MKRLSIVTATRAEYGLLFPLIRRIDNDSDLELCLVVTGSHLSHQYGNTIEEIREDGFHVSHEIPILENDNSPYGVSVTVANAIKGFAEYFRSDKPDMVVILGDRTEMLGVALAALNEGIPISHIHGGEVTEGAVDDSIRHSITKMSYLHFCSTEVYRQRVIQLGESPNRVFNVGALGVENVLNENLFSEYEIRYKLDIPSDIRYAVVTVHPVTLENELLEKQIEIICTVMGTHSDIFFVITSSNADVGGDYINNKLKEYSRSNNNSCFCTNLGRKRYLSAVKYASFVIGNSSSGIIEAPSLGTPTINIGDRQKGRIMAESVICCKLCEEEICKAIEKALKMNPVATYIYGDGHTSEKITEQIKKSLRSDISLKKEFYDLCNRLL